MSIDTEQEGAYQQLYSLQRESLLHVLLLVQLNLACCVPDMGCIDISNQCKADVFIYIYVECTFGLRKVAAVVQRWPFLIENWE